MAGSATVGTAVIKLQFDGKNVKAELNGISNEMESTGTKSGKRFGDAWTVAAGNLLAKGISKIGSAISNNFDKAISRVDTLKNFPKVMSNLGIAADESAESINLMAEKLQGLPTNLDQGAAAVQRFTSKNNDVKKSTDIFLALNNALLAGGMSTEIQATALEQISQAYAKGKPDMMEWRSIQTAMPAQLNQISKALFSNSDALDDYMKRAEKYANANPMSSTAAELVEQLEGVKNGTFDMTTALGTALRTGVISMDEFMGTIETLNKEGSEGFSSFEKQARDSTGGIQTAIAVMNSRITQGIAAVIDSIGQERIAEIATGIGNALREVGKALAQVVNFVIDNWNVIGPILGVLGGVAGTIIGINLALKAYQKVQTAVNGVQKVFSNGLGKISSGISKVSKTFQKSPIGGGAEKVGSIFTRLAETIKTAIGNIGGILKSLAQAIVEPLKVALQGLGEALASFFTALANPAIIMGAVSFAAAAAAIAAAIWLIGSAVGAIMPVLTDLFTNIIMPIAQFIADTVLNLIDALTQSVTILTQGALIPLGEFLANSLVMILQTVSDVITNLTQGALIPLINTLSGAFVDVARTVGDILNNIVTGALQGVANIISVVGDGFLKMGEAIKLALEGVQGVLQAFAALIMAIAAAAVAIVALVTGHSINYGDNYAHLFSKGGKVEGPGTATSDSIPAMLSDGEYVINAKSAQAIGYDNLDRINEGDYYGFSGLASDFANDYAAAPATSGDGVTVYMTNQINNEMDAEDIGRVMMQSIRRAA